MEDAMSKFDFPAIARMIRQGTLFVIATAILRGQGSDVNSSLTDAISLATSVKPLLLNSSASGWSQPNRGL
jgi:hypothetical protein